MTYEETLEYLFRQLPMYQRIGQAAYKADLNSTIQLMKVLGNPEQKLKVVHIAGTNGKGSASHLLASIFQEAGYKCGLYTSPHLVDFRERIRINGSMIPQDNVLTFVERYKTDFEAINLSFFEWSVGLAFDYFAQEEVDIAIVEVGMGGRLDSTNVVDPELSIITNIGTDHSQFLGESLAQIGREKAGIIKKNKPVVIGKSQRDTEGVFRKIALQLDAPITFADQQFPHDVPTNPLKGKYQGENFQTVLIAIEKLQAMDWQLSDDHISKGFENVLQNTGLRGRWEMIQDRPKVICDVAHNKEGLTYIAEQLTETPHHDLHLVLGFVEDKNVEELLELFPKHGLLYLCQPSIPRALSIERLTRLADQKDLKFQAFTSVKKAYQAALDAAHDDDLIYVGGSTFVVADLLQIK